MMSFVNFFLKKSVHSRSVLMNWYYSSSSEPNTFKYGTVIIGYIKKKVVQSLFSMSSS